MCEGGGLGDELHVLHPSALSEKVSVLKKSRGFGGCIHILLKPLALCFFCLFLSGDPWRLWKSPDKTLSLLKFCFVWLPNLWVNLGHFSLCFGRKLVLETLQCPRRSHSSTSPAWSCFYSNKDLLIFGNNTFYLLFFSVMKSSRVQHSWRESELVVDKEVLAVVCWSLKWSGLIKETLTVTISLRWSLRHKMIFEDLEKKNLPYDFITAGFICGCWFTSY